MTKAILYSAVSIGVLIFTTGAYAQALPEAESVSGDDIVVTGTIVSGEMKSIAAQRKADNIVNVLTSDGTTWTSSPPTGVSTGKAIAMAIVFGG